ncbi:MAG TPA: biotin--[acetyl-CoA-carboxylase] ligase [Ferruginibacter sp.]|nr:biotin--[acetyl-CoA-carboxylase] ligase [Ferruginibacter sp.]
MPLSRFFKILDTVDSTNNYAMEKVREGTAEHGQAWFAREQTSGKGQRGRSWQSQGGKNIAMSIVFEPELPGISDGFHLSAMVALTCHDFLTKYTDDECRIKWPNDLYWRDRKAGGILIENNYQGSEWKYAIVGIGINVNQTKFNDDIKNPVSFRQITGREFDAASLAEELYEMLMKRFETADAPFKTSLKKYNQHLYGLNKLVKLKKDNYLFETVIKEVNAAGQLVTVDAIERVFDFGSVVWV